MRKLRSTAVVPGVVLTAAALVVPMNQSAFAGPSPASEHFRARAGSQIADVSLLGRRMAFGSATAQSELDTVANRLSAEAIGLGSTLAATPSRSVARLNDPTATGGRRCVTPELAPVLARADSALRGPAGVAIPSVEVSPTCSTAMVTGDPSAFLAESAGAKTQLTVKLPRALHELLGTAKAALDPNVLATTVGDLTASAAPPQAQAAVGVVNGVLGSIVPGVALPQMEPSETVGGLLKRLGAGDLVRIDLSGASARNAADATSYSSDAVNHGGVIEFLPEFRGPGAGPLMKITVAASQALLSLTRSGDVATRSAINPVVRIESELLDKLPMAGPMVAGGLPGAMSSGPRSLEVAPGQSLSVLCNGLAAVLCSDISVRPAAEPTSSGDGHRVEASTVTLHLFKGLDALTPGFKLGDALVQPVVARVLEPLAANAGVTLGEPTGLSGVRLVMSGAVVEALGTSAVASPAAATPSDAGAVGALTAGTPAPTERPAAASNPAGTKPLPRTGGLPFATTTGLALLGAGGLGSALRWAGRRRF